MAKAKWVQVSGNTWYMDGPAKVGLVKISDTEAICIDSGGDQESGRKIRQFLDANGLKLKAIYNTHSNADHIGGNAYLLKQTGCRIYAPGIERDFTAHPLLEPSFLWGGYPMKDLRHKFLMAKPSAAEELTEEVLEDEFEMIPLPGHFFDMAGFRTPDNVVFLADCVSSRDVLDKYRIGFVYDVKAYLETLSSIEDMEADLFIPSHTEPVKDMRELAELNRQTVLQIGEDIVEFCRKPRTFEEILQHLFALYKLQMNAQQYVLTGSTIRSYLSWLQELGKLQYAFSDNRMLWLAAV